MVAKKQPRRRHIPQRTCVVCRRRTDKRELTRIVRPPAGEDGDETHGMVFVDPTGKQSGRGAYLCSRTECWDKALNTLILDQALKTTLLDEARIALAGFRPSKPIERTEPAG